MWEDGPGLKKGCDNPGRSGLGKEGESGGLSKHCGQEQRSRYTKLNIQKNV
jgi:hypothetical protein